MFQTTTLPNGVRILTARMDGAPSVAVFVGLAAGSRYEQPASAGIAHFAEHMFFKGTERRPTARDISAEIDGIGGEFNAFTGKELTAYYVKCAAASAPVAIDVLSDMLLASRFDADEIEREKGVISEEINMYLDTPRDLIGQVHDDLRFGDYAARPADHRLEGDGRRGHPRHVPRLPRHLVPARADGDRPRRRRHRRDGRRRGGAIRRPGGRHPPPAASPTSVIAGPTVRIERRDSDQRTYPERRRLPGRPCRPLRAVRAAGRARRRHVVAPLHRGARAPWPRLLRVRVARRLHRHRRAYVQAGVDAKRSSCGRDDLRATAPDGDGACPKRRSPRPSATSPAVRCSASRTRAG